MVSKDGNKRNNFKNHSEARSRAKNKRSSQKRDKVRDMKFNGEERFDEDFETRDKTSRTRLEDDFSVEAKPRPTREVQIGVVRGSKNARTSDTGRVTVSSDLFRKPGAMSWNDYKDRLLADTSNPALAARSAKSEVKNLLLECLTESLTETLHVSVTRQYVGTKGRGQQKRMTKRLVRDTHGHDCVIVPDASSGIIVVLPYRYVHFPATSLEDFDATFARLFMQERQVRVDRWVKSDPDEHTQPIGIFQSFDPSGVISPSETDLDGATPPVATFQSFGCDDVTPPSATNPDGAAAPTGTFQAFSIPTGAEAIEFMETYGPQMYQDALGYIQEHWSKVATLLSELYALSLVPQGDRHKYLLARCSSELMRGTVDIPSANAAVVKLLSIPCIMALFERIQRSGARDGPIADFQGIESFTEVLGSIDLPPTSAARAILLLMGSAAGFACAKTEKFNFPRLFSIITKVTDVPKCTSIEDAIILVIKYAPVVVAAVTAVAATRSWAPFFAAQDGVELRLANVKTAFVLHEQGTYPNTLFETRSDYIAELSTLHAMFRKKMASGAAPVDVVRANQSLNDMYAKVANDMSGKFLEAPYAACIRGESSIGKSSILRYIMNAIVTEEHGSPPTNEEVYTINPDDRFASGYHMGKKVIIVDDVGNTKASAGCPAPNPCSIFIELINNVATATNQADLGGKGSVFWNAMLVLATTNTEDLLASRHSNEPISILRRLGWFIRPVVRPEYTFGDTFMLDGDKLPLFEEVPIPDAWTFEVRRPVKVGDEITWLPCPDLTDEASIFDLLDFLKKDSAAHYARQRALASDVRNMEEAIDVDEARASAAHYDEQHGIVRSLEGKAGKPKPQLSKDSKPRHKNGRVGGFARHRSKIPPGTLQGFDTVRNIVSSGPSVNDCVAYSEVLRHRALDSTQRVCRWASLYDSETYYWMVVLAQCSTALTYFSTWWWLPVAALLWWLVWFLRMRARVVRKTMLTSAALGAALGLVLWMVLRPAKERVQVPSLPGANISASATSATPQGVTEMMEAARKNDVVLDPSAVPHAARTTTLNNLVSMVGKKSYFCFFQRGNVLSCAVMSPLRTGLYVLNYHTIKRVLLDSDQTQDISILMTRVNSQTMRFTVSASQLWAPDPSNCDVAFLCLNGPTEQDVRKYVMPGAWFRALCEHGASLPVADGKLAVLRAPMEVKTTTHIAEGKLELIVMQSFMRLHVFMCAFAGYDNRFAVIGTKVDRATKGGDCGSLLFLDTMSGNGTTPIIAGMLSGVAALGGQESVVITPIVDEVVAEAEVHFARLAEFQEGPRLFGQPEELRLSPNRCNATLHVDGIPGVELLGSLVVDKGPGAGTNRTSLCTFKSQLRRGPLADEPQTDGVLGATAHKFPPVGKKYPEAYTHMQRCITRMAKHPLLFDRAAFEAAVLDRYAGARDATSGQLPPRPATLFEAVNGTAYMKALPLDTSAGFGLKGKKLPYFRVACDPDCADSDCKAYHPKEGEHIVPGRTNYYPGSEILEQVSALEARLLNGGEGLAVFRASLKDEPIPQNKDKIRVFFVGMCAWNLLLRRYYSPIYAAMQKDMVRSECAVGIDVMSAQWEELMQHMDSYNLLEALGGDYSNFDNSIPEEMIGAEYSIPQNLARDAGWDARSLRLMEAIALNMTRPVYIFLGTAILVIGTNPSGVVVTTLVNSGVNSLVHRYAFYKKNPAEAAHCMVIVGGKTPFQISVALTTYGDDVKGAVKADGRYAAITNHDVRTAAAEFGMTYGPADKGSGDLPTYYVPQDLTFLKCEDVFVQELGRRVGRIALSSIRKSLAFERNAGFEARRCTFESALRLYFPWSCTIEGGLDSYEVLRQVMLGVLNPDGITVEGAGMLPTHSEVCNSLLGGEVSASSMDDVWEMIV